MLRTSNRLLILLAISFLTLEVFAGGSGLNVVVIVNQNSTNSVQLGNYYREQRNVPPQNLLRVNWTGPNTVWTVTDFNNTIVTPFLQMLSDRQLTNQIDYVVFSMDFPYQVSSPGNGYNGTTSALFYGYKNDPNGASSCEIAPGSTNLYAGSEDIFRSTPPVSPSSNSFLATMITASNLATAKMVVHQGAISDATFPTQTVWLGKSTDADRNVRYTEFDNAVFNTRVGGLESVSRTNLNFPLFSAVILGYANGYYYYDGTPVPLLVPGAMADNLTSSSGQLFQDTAGQTTLLRFLELGASGSYGTVTEPCNFVEKFPDPQNYFYQSRGFSLAECYYQSLVTPYEGLVAGEPLAAPFAHPGSGTWVGLASNAIVSGVANLSAQFTASDAAHPLQQVDLFVDGNWLQTITNIAPQTGNVLNVKLNGFAASYTIPANATIRSVASNLVGVLNGIAYQNNTKVTAIDHGDRIELQSATPFTKTGSQISISASSTNSSGALTTFVRTANSSTNFVDSIAQGSRSYQFSGSLLLNPTLTLSVTKTNGQVATVSVTNTTSGATVAQFTLQFLTAISNAANLQGIDGLTAGDLEMSSDGSLAQFDLVANAQGFAAAQLSATISGSVGLVVTPSGANLLNEKLTDLQPRNHLYITAGTSNLTVNFPLNTANLSDGFHELAAVAYEGSHVRTQTRATQNIVVHNTTLSAAFASSITGTNSSLEPTLQFSIVANTNNIGSIQLFSTGGLLATVNNQSSATFSINFATLGIGTHPFYAIVTDNLGHRYRTQTQNVGLVGVNNNGTTLTGVDLSFPLQVSAPPALLVWPATAGRSYNILSTTNLLSPFQLRTIVVPTNSIGKWTETNSNPAQQFYRVSVSP